MNLHKQMEEFALLFALEVPLTEFLSFYVFPHQRIPIFVSFSTLNQTINCLLIGRELVFK